MEKRSFRIAGPDVVFENFDGDLVILNLATGRYFGLDPSGGAVWAALSGGIQLDIVARGMGKPDGLDAFLQAMLENGLLAEDPGAASSPDASLIAALAACTTPPRFEAYDDLADLIVADPIHDTSEEQGWPVRDAE